MPAAPSVPHPRARAVRVVLSLTAALLGCGEPPPGPDPNPPAEPLAASLQISPRDLLVLEGEPASLSATVRDSAGAVLERDVSWSAYPPEIVTVSSGGVVQGVGVGTAYVAAGTGDLGDTVAVRVRVRFQALSAGAAHTCGITTMGSLYCWGWNREGRLGTGTTEPAAMPARAASVTTFSQVSAGWEVTCGLSSAGTSCWGSNRSGQLGSTSKSDALAPVPVADDPSFLTVAAHTTHACGIAGRNRAAWCWGAGWTGQRGAGDAAGLRAGPVSGTLRFRALDVGRLFSCGVTTEGAAYCWGANDAGQLGRPDAPETCGWPDGSAHPCATEPVPVASALTFDSIAVGTDHTCALAADGSAHCWGRNDAGQLGDGSVEGASSPRPVAGAVAFTWITAGDRHACALDGDGGAWCWGDNALGALGTDAALEACGDVPCSRRPVPVATTLRFRSLTASRGRGGAHTCGVATDGFAYCWGNNAHGQLGTGVGDGGGATPRVVAGQRG